MKVKDLVREKILQIHRYFFSKQYKNILELLHPCVLPLDKKRYGKEGDGAYILPDNFIEKDQNYTLLSFGIFNDISFEKDFNKDFPHIDIYAFDPTIEQLPEENKHIHFSKIGLAGNYVPSKNLYPIDGILAHMKIDPHNKFIIKMDIEGWEWDFLDTLSESKLDVPLITLEIHFLPTVNIWETLLLPFKFTKKQRILKKLLSKFYVFHIHANNYKYYTFDDFVFPIYMEATLISKEHFRDQIVNDVSKYNKPNFENNPDHQFPFIAHR